MNAWCLRVVIDTDRTYHCQKETDRLEKIKMEESNKHKAGITIAKHGADFLDLPQW
jgi:hypothetical protein